MADDFNHMIVEMKTHYNSIMQTKCHDRGAEVHRFEWTKYPVAVPEKLTEFAYKLQDLYDKCCSVKDVDREPQSSLSRLLYSKYQYHTPSLAARFLRW